MRTGLLALLCLAAAADAAAPARPALLPHARLIGRPAPSALARNLIAGSANVRALSGHMDALDREDPRQNREWVTCLSLVSREGTLLRHALRQGRALIKNGVELDAGSAALSFEPGRPLAVPAHDDADGARQALARAAVEEAEPMAAAIILRAQGADELDRISAYEASAEEASLRVGELRAHLAALVGEKGVDEGLSTAPPKGGAPAAPEMPDFMRGPVKTRRE